MTKQEKIREGIARDFLFEVWKEAKSSEIESWDDVTWESLPEKHKTEYLKTAVSLLNYLHSQGLVIKVDRKLPKRNWYKDWGGESGEAGYKLALEDMVGYVAVKPLIQKDI